MTVHEHMLDVSKREDDRWWVPVEAINGWVGNEDNPPRAMSHTDGSVEFRGWLTGGQEGKPQLRLPVSMVPYFEGASRRVQCWDGTYIEIWQNGEVLIEPLR